MERGVLTVGLFIALALFNSVVFAADNTQINMSRFTLVASEVHQSSPLALKKKPALKQNCIHVGRSQIVCH